MNKKILYYIWLSSTLSPGSKTAKLVLEHFGDIEKVYNAEKEDFEAISISGNDLVCLCNKNLDNAEHYYKYCVSKNIGILCYDNPYYPERLKIIDNPPPMFYYQGKLLGLDDYPCITMVGTRSCSERGFRLAYESGFNMALKGGVVVNGLALGIDGACISGALDAGGYAIGVLGCGIDRIYPFGNKDIFERLAGCGLIITEFPPFSAPKNTNFPVRNRVMSALSLATVVLEADTNSGAMITARHALQQGRRIFAVPAKPYDKTYSGALELIKDGATVFTEAEDVLLEYSMSFPHRINLAKKRDLPVDKLSRYVATYFKKDVDPDEPVNRRFIDTIKAKTKKKGENLETAKEKEAIPKPSPTKVEPSKNVTENTPSAVRQESVITDDAASVDLSTLSETELKIYNIIKDGKSLTADEIADKGIKIDDVLSALTLLEIYGHVCAKPGGKYEII